MKPHNIISMVITLLLMSVMQIAHATSRAVDTIYAKDFQVTNAEGNMLSDLINKTSENTVILLENKVYKTKQLRIPHRLKIVGDQGTIIQPVDGANFNALIIATYPLMLENVVLQGNKGAFWGIYSTSDLSITSVTIMDFHGNRSGPGNGIRHISTDSKSRLCVDNSVIKNISGYEDGVVGNYIGAHRGILTNGGNIVIRNTTFENILGEEDADCIHIQTEGDSRDSWKSAGTVVIDNCSFIDFGKRAVKIQASDVTVRNNKIRNNNNKIYSAISIYGSRNVVENNEIDVANATAALTVISGRRNKLVNNTVTVDREEGGRLSWGIAFDKPSHTTLSGNTFITNGRRTPFSFSTDMVSSARRTMEKNNSVQVRKR